MSFGLYVHIPYCRQRCNYCDFYTAGGQQGVPDVYIAALIRDFAAFAPRGAAATKPLRPKTVYFGGGTPSLLSPGQLHTLLQAFKPAKGAEVTIEANPEEISLGLLQGYVAAGANRISFGVQTAFAQSLRSLGRRHSPQQAAAAFAMAQKAGFANISGDIMLALPGYTNKEFDQTLAIIKNGGATHVSAYMLKIEEGTPFGRRPPKGLPNADESADFYLYALQRLQQSGYLQYEISNFAQKGFIGRHNLIYWQCENYLGLGPAAHSCIGGERFCFAPGTKAYIKNQPQKMQQGLCSAEDFIMLQLRLAKGLDETALQRRFGTGLGQKQQQALKLFAKHGFAQKQGRRWCLTPKGMLVQNQILARLF